VNFSAISIPAAAVDKKTTDLLSGIENLDQILLEVDGRFFMAEARARSRIDPSPEDLDERCVELRRATDSGTAVAEILPSSENDPSAPAFDICNEAIGPVKVVLVARAGGGRGSWKQFLSPLPILHAPDLLKDLFRQAHF